MRVKVIFDSRLRLGDYSKVVIPIPHNVEYVQDLVEHLRETFGLNETDTGRITVSIDDFVITNNQLVKDVLVNDDMVRIRCERTPDVRSPLGSVSMHRTEDEFVMIERPIKRFRESVKSESTSSPKYSMQLPDPIAASDSKVAESSSSLNEPVEPGASEEYPSEVTHPAPGQTQTCALHSDQEDEEKNVRHSPASPALSTI